MITLMTYNRGYRWVQITDPAVLRQEGISGENCLAFDECSYRDHAQTGEVILYFLQDDSATTHAIATYLPKLQCMEDVECEGGRPVRQHLLPYVCDLLNHLQVKTSYSLRMKFAGIVKINGLWSSAKSIPSQTYVKHDLNLNNYNSLSSLPSYLTVTGRLSLCKTQIRELPEHLVVNELDLRFTFIKTLPSTLVCSRVLRHRI